MATGRMPGPLGTHTATLSTAPTQMPTPVITGQVSVPGHLGAPPSPLPRPVPLPSQPVSPEARNWLLMTPPCLCQLQLYKGTEAMYACWATSGEMVAKWKDKNAFWARPKFEDYLAPGKGPEYLNFILDWFDAWGFEGQNSGGFGTWKPTTIAPLLRDKGPLVCVGNFGGSGATAPAIGDQAHAIVVYGFVEQGRGVYYIDPWDADTKHMSLDVFAAKLWRSYNAVYARKPNYRA